MKIKSTNLEQKLLFIVGLFSTFQLTELFGMTIFTELMFVLALFLVVKHKKMGRFSISEIGFIILITISEIILIISGKYGMWKGTSLKSYILLLVVFALYLLMKRLSLDSLKYFFRGLYWSCVVQLIWCGLQLILYKVFSINLNQLIFTDILHLQMTVTQTKNGVMVITGLNSNAGMLVPILLTGLFLADKIWVKILFVLMAFLLGSTTPMIAISIYLVLAGIMKLRNIFKSISRKRFMQIIGVFAVVMVVVTIVLLSSNSIRSHLFASINNTVNRISAIFEGNVKDASTNVHIRYYTSLPTIMENNGILTNLFGYGVKCAGIPYVELYNQYPDIVWIPESDFVTYVLNVGILGAIFFYALLIRNIYKGAKIDKKYLCFQITVILAGLFYGIQLNWLILTELLLYEMIHRKHKVEQINTPAFLAFNKIRF